MATGELLGVVAEHYGLDPDKLLLIRDEIASHQINFNVNGQPIAGNIEEFNNPIEKKSKSM